MNFKNCPANALVTEVAVAVGEDEPIIAVIIDVDAVRTDVDDNGDDDDDLIDDDNAADDCVDEDAPLVPVDVSPAASGTARARAEHAVLLAGWVPT